MPPPGRMPTRAWVSANTARSEAMRKSQPSAISRPPVNTAPLIAPTIGVRILPVASMQLCERNSAKYFSAVALRLLEVDAGAERRVGAREHDGAHRLVVIGLRQRGVSRTDQVAAQRIPGLGPVECQHAHRTVIGDENEWFGHGEVNAGTGWRCSPDPAAAAAGRRGRM